METDKMNCGLCESVITTRLRNSSYCEKACALCEVSKNIHRKCAVDFLRAVHGKTNPKLEEWVKQTDAPLYCIECKESCFFCQKKHSVTSNKNAIKVAICSTCEVKFCYCIETTKNRVTTLQKI